VNDSFGHPSSGGLGKPKLLSRRQSRFRWPIDAKFNSRLLYANRRIDAANFPAHTAAPVNQLYYGDNLQVLREHIADESVDLIYLDPPFNSKRDYNLLFKAPSGHDSEAQIEAFEDTWHWNQQAEREFDELLHQPNTDVAEMMKALRGFLGENDMMAYLTMMANRLLQLHRVLKSTGSLYLHCDPTASHYLKIVLDGVFGKDNFINEIIWKRSYGHGDSTRSMGRSHDVIFYFSKGSKYTLNRFFHDHDPDYIESFFKHEDARGTYKLENLTSPNPRPNLTYPYKGYPSPKMGWRVNLEKMKALDADDRLHFPAKKDGRIMRKVYLHELGGQPMMDMWNDLQPLSAHDKERLGYQTQKPLSLLERIISASSNEGDVVLDPFCGCGTAVHAAQKLKRKWIGIDITHLAISLIEKRLKDAFKTGLEFEIHGTPKDLDAARDLANRDKYQFQWWAVSLVDAQPFQGKKKGADTGIDGLKFFGDYVQADEKLSKSKSSHKTCKLIVSVKGGENLKADDVRSLMAVREREGADIAVFISLQKPTKGMISDAASAGFYQDGAGRKFPRVQLLTIEGLLSKKQRAEHPDYEPDLNFKKAKTEANAAQKELGV
jgi:site-specific DNA-methyltransferase (adenine-specific)